MVIGAQFYTLREFCKDLDSFALSLKKVADIGYTTVQISGTCQYDPQWLKEQLDNTGLTCAITHIPAQQHQPVVACGRCQPPGHGQICGCTTQLLSPGLYEEFIMPLDDVLLGVYPHGGLIHLCGSHTQLIPLFAKMPHLKCVQLNDKAAEDLQFYVDGLRDDQVIYLNPCEGMTTKQALKLAGDKKIIIVYGYEEE